MQRASRRTKPQGILEELFEFPGVPISSRSLFELVWGEKFFPEIDTNTLRANVCYARRLLNGEGELKAIRGQGYVFIPEVQC